MDAREEQRSAGDERLVRERWARLLSSRPCPRRYEGHRVLLLHTARLSSELGKREKRKRGCRARSRERLERSLKTPCRLSLTEGTLQRNLHELCSAMQRRRASARGGTTGKSRREPQQKPRTSTTREGSLAELRGARPVSDVLERSKCERGCERERATHDGLVRVDKVDRARAVRVLRAQHERESRLFFSSASTKVKGRRTAMSDCWLSLNCICVLFDCSYCGQKSVEDGPFGSR